MQTTKSLVVADEPHKIDYGSILNKRGLRRATNSKMLTENSTNNISINFYRDKKFLAEVATTNNGN